ncbi:integral membrane protein [Xylariaceae sp. FL0662B]|nr:integral membrane protein [Xylariaceae sp. FL0662B]
MRSRSPTISNAPPYSKYAYAELCRSRDGDMANAFTDKMTSSCRNVDMRRHERRRQRQRPSRQDGVRSSFHLSSSFLRTGLFWLIACTWLQPTRSVMIPFDNCLPDSYLYTNKPQDEVQLQWIPMFVDAEFDTENPAHNLRVTVWGNVTGRVGTEPLPPPGSPDWSDPKKVLQGKILDEPNPNLPATERKATTLHSKVDVLTYEPYTSNLNFCQNIANASCPLGPVFNTTPLASPYGLPSFNISNDFDSTYSFTTFAPTLIIWYGDVGKTTIGCVSTAVTPDLGGVAWSLKFAPLFVLILVGFATAFAAIFSPWGTSDVFHWTTNYGRDPDLLRLVTPGFGDCLQYIQFIVLTGSLSLHYPGFYQPVVSQGSWSALMFNQSFVSKAEPWQRLVDGIYVTNGSYGLENMSQLNGMGQPQDLWAGMMVWLLVIIGAVLFLIQVGFFLRWLLRYITRTTEEDLRAKNIPFSVGNVVRIVFSYFLLPIVALSTFQLVIAAKSLGVLVGMAVITLVLVIGFATWLMYLIATTKPRAHLFDDLPTVLLYGSLYNTYSDEAAAFAIIPIILTIFRGITFGAVQPSGTAQLVLLAVCEVIQMLTLHAFRPFHSPTSMNAYHTGFSALRFISVILMISFAPSLGITEGPKGWIGYAILLIHASVLLFGFFLNALQTIVEVIARLCGAGGDDIRGQTRGGLSKIFGARQLSRRVDRRGGPSRQSQLSTSAMLSESATTKDGYNRVRSGSAGSMGILLNPQQRSSSALDAPSVDPYGPLAGGSFTPTTPGDASTFSLPSPGQATRPQPAADPYYRPPRARRTTIGEGSSSSPHRARASVGSADLSTRRVSQAGGPFADGDPDASGSGRATPAPAPAPVPYAPVFAPRADYSTREVDFYYRVPRGPALNSEGAGRKLGTGPADPTSPLATAAVWLKGLFGGKTKEKDKGFEVVRSARMPPAMRARGGEFSEDPPKGIPVAMGVLRNGPIESDDEENTPKPKKAKRDTTDSAQGGLLDGGGETQSDGEVDSETVKVSKDPPLLPDLDAGESFRMPSRMASKASRYPSQRTARAVPEVEDVPEVPRKSSKRHSSVEPLRNTQFDFGFPTGTERPQTQPSNEQSLANPTAKMPFDRSNSQRRLSGSSAAKTEDFNQLPSAESPEERPTSFGHVHQHSISRVDPEQGVDLLGSSAELVTDPRKPSPSSSVSRRS